MMASDPTKREMADREGPRYVENPAGEQLLHGGETALAQWPAPMVSTAKSHSHEDDHNHNHDHHHHHDHDHEHHHKKSVLTKVKEKAKKWKQVLTRRKHGHDDEGNTTPTSGVSLDEEDDESIEQDHEYPGSTMDQSKTALTMEKEHAHPYQELVPSPTIPSSTTDHHHLTTSTRIDSMQHQNPVPTPATKPTSSTIHTAQKEKQKLHHLDSFKGTSKPQILTSSTTANSLATETKEKGESPTNSTSKSVTETVTEMLTPAYKMVSEARHKIVAKIQSPTAKDETGAKMEWDKGVSVKEYLLHKLEPGEEERALSEVITEAISPRKGKVGLGQMNTHSEEMSVVEKVREAMSSLLGKDEQTGSQISKHSANLNSESTHVDSKVTHSLPNQISEVTHGASMPASKYAQTSKLDSEYQYTHENLNPFSEDTHGASDTTSESVDGASSVDSKSTHGVMIPTSEYTHASSIPGLGHTYGESVPVSEHVHGIARPETKHNQGGSSPLPVSTNPFSSARSVTEYSSVMSSNTTSLHGATAYPHGARVPASKGTNEASIHALEHTQQASIPSSEYAHGVRMPEYKYNSGHALPLQVSTNPIPSATSVTKNPSVNHPSTNMATFSDYTSHHTEIEETGGRRLQTN